VSKSRLLKELASAGPEHLDPAYVAGYDRKAQLDPTADLNELRSRGLDTTSTLIDIGAGTGTFAVAAASICRRVIAVDVSPAMLDAIKAKIRERGLTNVECVQAGFLSYEHRGAPVDFIYTRKALHHSRLLERHCAQTDRRDAYRRRDPETPRPRVLLRSI
jgi:FkbM family methyltransferase